MSSLPPFSTAATVPENRGRYVLITPAKNEEALIGETITSVVSQTIRPAQWIIVSDGSTDRTDEIVTRAAASERWIKLLRLPARAGRNFAAVVHATELGIKSLDTNEYDFVGLLDSDVRFQADYFAEVLKAFAQSPRLGLAGGVAIDVGLSRERLPKNRQDVPGALQFFRRECFERLGGLIAIPEGGWDALTCARARMLGYETRLLTHLIVDHLKPRNVSEGGIFRRKWQMGIRDYALGYHPAFELVKCLGRLGMEPYVVGALSWFVGYWWAVLRQRPRLVPDDLRRFVRKEQMARLRRTIIRR